LKQRSLSIALPTDKKAPTASSRDRSVELRTVFRCRTLRPTIACTCRLSLLKGCGQWQELLAIARINCIPATCSGNLKRACGSGWAANEAKAVIQTAALQCHDEL
jgi:hypothetical protein